MAGWGLLALAPLAPGWGAVYDVRVVTDASPDYGDLPRLVRSATSRWAAPAEKCWAMFYWVNRARRQTSPMEVHGLAVTDPIRQFNDYGYTMCSTVAGMNCALWDAMGFGAKYWDISLHTVAEVEYEGGWHMYDSSMSALYTLCDGRTIAGVADIGKEGACAASESRAEPGHIARYHCLMATSPNGFLTGADTVRSLEEEARCFRPSGLKHRPYYYDWDGGHRYRLNLRERESYTRHYQSLGSTPGHYVPNHGQDPETPNPRYRIRGNGVWRFSPSLDDDRWAAAAHDRSNMARAPGGGLCPRESGVPGRVVFKVDGGNVITGLRIRGELGRETEADEGRIEVSCVNGRAWQTVWEAAGLGVNPVSVDLADEVNGAYEVLVRVTLMGRERGADVCLRRIELETITQINSKTQPQLAIGRNTVCVGGGDPVESIVFWPDLGGDRGRPWIESQENMATSSRHPGYQGVMYAAQPGTEARVIFRLDAPRDIVRVEYGGRLYNRAPGSRIDFLHSFDGGRTWIEAYSLTRTDPPWDVIHYEAVDAIPSGTRAVWCQYRLRGPKAGPDACSLYAVRLEATHRPVDPQFRPIEVDFRWRERQADYLLVPRAHTEIVTDLPHRYVINVGGADHPIVDELEIRAHEAGTGQVAGYSDGRDAGGDRHLSRWVTCGTNYARGRPYTVSIPSTSAWGAGDPEGRKLTDGVAGPPYAGGIAPRYALCWDRGTRPAITVDLGQPRACGAFRIQLGAGWPWWNALEGEVKDGVDVSTSVDGGEYCSRGSFELNLRRKDIPANHFVPDDEAVRAHLYERILPAPVEARYVRFEITPARTLTVSEVEVLDFIRYEPFDLRVALP